MGECRTLWASSGRRGPCTLAAKTSLFGAFDWTRHTLSCTDRRPDPSSPRRWARPAMRAQGTPRSHPRRNSRCLCAWASYKLTTRNAIGGCSVYVIVAHLMRLLHSNRYTLSIIKVSGKVEGFASNGYQLCAWCRNKGEIVPWRERNKKPRFEVPSTQIDTTQWICHPYRPPSTSAGYFFMSLTSPSVSLRGITLRGIILP